MLIWKTLSKFILALFKCIFHSYQRFRYSLLNQGSECKTLKNIQLRIAVIYRDIQLYEKDKIRKQIHYWSILKENITHSSATYRKTEQCGLQFRGSAFRHLAKKKRVREFIAPDLPSSQGNLYHSIFIVNKPPYANTLVSISK